MYVAFNENPRGNYYAGDCVVRAIAVVTEKSWDEIYAALCAEGFYIGDWGNNNGAWDWYLRSLGYKRYVCSNDCPYCYSVADFARDHPTGKYVLASGSHAIALVSGDWHDAWDSASVPVIYYYTKEGE